MQQIYVQVWLELPKEVKVYLISIFGLVRTGITEVRDNTVVSDGFSNDDLKAITLEKMCAYIGSEETFMRAWELTLMKIHSELYPPVGEIKSEEPEIIPEIKLEEVKKPWCEMCGSMGARHKVGCPLYEK